MYFGLGTANFDKSYGIFNKSKMNINDAKKIIDICRKKKIKVIDTAIDYKDCDKMLGNIGVNDFNVITGLEIHLIRDS